MTSEDIIRMAKEAGLYFKDDDMICEWLDELRCFAELVRADEREACAKLVWTTPEPEDEYVPLRMAVHDAIRGRGNT